MRILNVMLSAGRGGLEKAAADYTQALIMEKHDVITILNPNSIIQNIIFEMGGAVIPLHNLGEWDLWARLRLKFLIKKINPDCIIAHGRRAAILLQDLHPHVFPVTHSGYQSHLMYFSGLITMTKYICQEFIDHGYPKNRIYQIPNMIQLNESPMPSSYHIPIHLGALGRFEEQKGFQILIQSAKILQNKGYNFQLTIAGDGSYKENLQQLVQTLNLENIVNFPGWVQSPQEFFKKIDIFCLPSLREPFGIVLLEAYNAGVPSVTSDADGPREIACDQEDALIVPKNNPQALAEGIEKLIVNPDLAKILAKNAFEKVKNVYNIKIVSKKLTQILTCLIRKERT